MKDDIRKPRFALWVLNYFIPGYDHSSLYGDFEEMFYVKGHTVGRAKALFWLWTQILKSIPVFLQKSFSWSITMFKNYLKVAFRNLKRNKTYSLINISGLAMGMASCILILLYVSHEKSFDSFHENANNLYRIQMDRYDKGAFSFSSAVTYPPVGPSLKQDMPEVEDFARLYPSGGILTYLDTKHREDDIFIADNSFLTMFSYEIVSGDIETALDEPNTIVISESLAKKFFNDVDPVGKTVQISNWNGTDMTITAVFKDIPDNSHLFFNALYSMKTFEKNLRPGSLGAWGWYDFYTYVLLNEAAKPKELEAKLPDFLDKYYGERLAQMNRREVFLLQPLRDIHLHSNLGWEAQTNGNATTVFILTVIAYLILFIALVNFINLATARSFERAKEVGVRKVLGAFKSQLVKQFISEAVLLNVISIAVSFVIVLLFLPFLNDVAGKNLVIDVSTQLVFWTGTLSLFVVCAVLAGAYPALFLASFKPISVIKNDKGGSLSGMLSRKGLIIAQFAFSIFLIAGTITVFNQLDYMRKQDLGLDINQTIVLEGAAGSGNATAFTEKIRTFRNEVESISSVKSISTSSNVPGRENWWISSYSSKFMETGDRVNTYINSVDDKFFDAFNIEFISGRNFSYDFGTDDSLAVIINETAAKAYQFGDLEEAIGSQLFTGSGRPWRQIVGVIKDYNQESLKKSVEPNLYLLDFRNPGYYSLKVNTSDMEKTVNEARDIWERVFPESPFNYFFLDEFFAQQYKVDEQFGKVFGAFSFLAIFIACLGLFGVASFSVESRIKEIGIRKVLGASVTTVINLIVKDFVILVLTANLIAWPITYFAMNRWLMDFAYKIEIGWMVFIMSGILAVMIALVTVCFQSVKAALANPVNALKYE